jgi:hypothetical protein
LQVFILDESVTQSSKYYIDKHIVKIPLEITQILSTAVRKLGCSSDIIYKSTHENHPWVKWCCESINNVWWLLNLHEGLMWEYCHRYRKNHATWVICDYITKYLESIGCEIPSCDDNTTPFPLVLPEENYMLSINDDSKQYVTNIGDVNYSVVRSYMKYYMTSKKDIARWTNREVPEWFKNYFD